MYVCMLYRLLSLTFRQWLVIPSGAHQYTSCPRARRWWKRDSGTLLRTRRAWRRKWENALVRKLEWSVATCMHWLNQELDTIALHVGREQPYTCVCNTSCMWLSQYSNLYQFNHCSRTIYFEWLLWVWAFWEVFIVRGTIVRTLTIRVCWNIWRLFPCFALLLKH